MERSQVVLEGEKGTESPITSWNSEPARRARLTRMAIVLDKGCITVSLDQERESGLRQVLCPPKRLILGALKENNNQDLSNDISLDRRCIAHLGSQSRQLGAGSLVRSGTFDTLSWILNR